jgi:hypothetical protein
LVGELLGGDPAVLDVEAEHAPAVAVDRVCRRCGPLPGTAAAVCQLLGDYRPTLNSNTVIPFSDGAASPLDWYFNQSKDQVAGSDALITVSEGTTNMLCTNNCQRKLAASIPSGDPADL